MNKSLLDTDIFSEFFKGVNAQVAAKATAYVVAFGRLTISTITLMEVVKGFQKVNRPDRVQAVLNALATEEVLDFDQPSAELAGRIAAIALTHGLTLVTGNTAHFQRIQALGYALKLEDWRQP